MEIIDITKTGINLETPFLTFDKKPVIVVLIFM